MSKKNSLEEKSKRRAFKKIKKAQNNAPITHKQVWISVKDKYGNEKPKAVTMPVVRATGLN